MSYYKAPGGGATPIVQGQTVGAFSNALSTPAQPYNMTSNAPDLQTTAKPDKAAGRGCRDVIFSILFYIHLAAIVYAAVVYAPQAAMDVAGNNNNNRRLSTALRWLQEDGTYDNNYEAGDIEINPNALLTVLVIAGLLSFVCASLALGFMMKFAESLIKIALWFNIVLLGIMALLSAVGGAIPSALMFLFFAGLSAYYAYRVWSRIPFAASNLVTAVSAVQANMGLAFYAYWSVILLFLWSILWMTSASSTLYVLGNCNAEGECESVNGGLVFLFMLSYYWTAQVISNVVHVTTAGTVGTWWFVPHEANGCCSQAVRESYVRSLTTSFGSICLGSLIVALIQAIRETVRQIRDSDDSILACVADCILGCIESIVEYFNKWAFVYVGLYGMSFMEAGKNVMTLFRNRGWTAIIADMMIDTVLFMVSLGVGLLVGLLSVVIGAIAGQGDGATMIIAFLVGCMMGYAIAATLFSLVGSAVNTVIVCYAEAPNEFQANHPELSNRMRETWRQAWPNEFNY